MSNNGKKTANYAPKLNELASQLGIEPDDPLLLVLQENDKLATELKQVQKVIETWTETNLGLTNLLDRQTKLIDKQTNLLERQAQRLQQLELLNEDYRKALTVLPNLSTALSSLLESTDNQELNSLSMQIAALQRQISNQEKNSKNILTTTHLDKRLKELIALFPLKKEEGSSTTNRWWGWPERAAAVMLGSIFFALVNWTIFQTLPDRKAEEIQAYLYNIWSRTGWNQTKLERIEKRLGIDSNR
ncbi:MAG TPA: hypothetical protein DCE56_21965 [Cyanobacteria bacterium UBA8553]|nr:hypothetical protein [Cyanobacteria bacterium UBA8553]HAJ62294.1 hypothetical protein [Cyanobacteria bacterium UBA8543]